MDHGDMCPPWKGLYNIVCVGSRMYNLVAYEYMREQRKGRVYDKQTSESKMLAKKEGKHVIIRLNENFCKGLLSVTQISETYECQL